MSGTGSFQQPKGDVVVIDTTEPSSSTVDPFINNLKLELISSDTVRDWEASGRSQLYVFLHFRIAVFPYLTLHLRITD